MEKSQWTYRRIPGTRTLYTRTRDRGATGQPCTLVYCIPCHVNVTIRIPCSLSLTTIKTHKLMSPILSISFQCKFRHTPASSQADRFASTYNRHMDLQIKCAQVNHISKFEIMPASHILNSCQPDRLTDDHIINTPISHTSDSLLGVSLLLYVIYAYRISYGGVHDL